MKRRIICQTGLSHEMMPSVELVERNESPLGVTLVNSERVNKVNPCELVQLAQEIAKAEEFVRANTSSKLSLIAEQIRFLQSQAVDILREARHSSELHRAACNFQKIPGRIYFLYERPSGQKYFSLLSPSDWKDSPPHEYQGAFRLETDMSWTAESNFSDRDRDMALLGQLMDLNDPDQLRMIEN